MAFPKPHFGNEISEKGRKNALRCFPPQRLHLVSLQKRSGYAALPFLAAARRSVFLRRAARFLALSLPLLCPIEGLPDTPGPKIPRGIIRTAQQRLAASETPFAGFFLSFPKWSVGNSAFCGETPLRGREWCLSLLLHLLLAFASGRFLQCAPRGLHFFLLPSLFDSGHPFPVHDTGPILASQGAVLLDVGLHGLTNELRSTHGARRVVANCQKHLFLVFARITARFGDRELEEGAARRMVGP